MRSWYGREHLPNIWILNLSWVVDISNNILVLYTNTPWLIQVFSMQNVLKTTFATSLSKSWNIYISSLPIFLIICSSNQQSGYLLNKTVYKLNASCYICHDISVFLFGYGFTSTNTLPNTKFYSFSHKLWQKITNKIIDSNVCLWIKNEPSLRPLDKRTLFWGNTWNIFTYLQSG